MVTVTEHPLIDGHKVRHENGAAWCECGRWATSDAVGLAGLFGYADHIEVELKAQKRTERRWWQIWKRA